MRRPMPRWPTPSELDALPWLGEGATGQLRRRGRLVFKVAHPAAAARERLKAEAHWHRALEREGVPVPAFVGFRRAVLVRAFVPGRTLAGRTPSRTVLERLFALHRRLVELGERWGVRFDFTPSNLVLVRGRPVLLDAGPRAAPPRFRAESFAAFVREWKEAVHQRRPAARKLLPFGQPPSGRFHIEVPLGPDPRARVLWRNVSALGRLGLPWRDAELRSLGAFTTRPARATTTGVATRYVDMIKLDRRNGPRGDGRAVTLGVVATDDGPRDVQLKGLGPTPLAYDGVPFHEDGRVSFPRTLWEVTVADELARLGFDVPEYLAVLSAGATTVDNTHRRWPAAVGVRVARTFVRLGHLRRFSNRPSAARALLDDFGRRNVGPDFDGDRPAHRRRVLAKFSHALGFDVGRSDALHAFCFNPTPGNVRLDGHPLDYSTVRFQRHYAPDFKFLEHRYAVRIHRLVWRRLVALAVDVFGEARLLDAPQAQVLTRETRRYERAYRDGFFAGLNAFLCAPAHVGTRRQRDALVRAWQALRALRGGHELDFAYWKQRCAGPRFDVVGRLPTYVRALRRGVSEPERALVLEDRPLQRAEQRVAARFASALAPFLRTGQAVKRWDQVLRPFVECEALAELLYRRSTPDQFDRWKELMATGRHLPFGTHDYAKARVWARRLGHVELPSLEGGSEYVVGLTPEGLAGLRRVLRRVLGARLLGAIAHGSRVMERGELRARLGAAFVEVEKRGARGVREGGPSAEHSSDLDLKVFVRGPISKATQRTLELKLGRALRTLELWLPLAATEPPRQRLIVTASADVRRAFVRWNGRARQRTLGKPPIPGLQAVVVLDATPMSRRVAPAPP